MSKPLNGIRIGASYLAADVESQIREKIRVMGGEFHHELTPATDFLIVGKRWTEKYNYAIQHEITLIGQEAFFEAHTRWVQGEELDAAALWSERRLAAFENMIITITNMDNGQRDAFQQFLEAQGASYVSSLNQRVNVLVSALDKGKKVNGARKWQIPVVAPKWMTDSGKLGAALDPQNYDPGNPRATSEPPMIVPKSMDREMSPGADTDSDSSRAGTPSAALPAVPAAHTESSTYRLKRRMPALGLMAKRMPTAIGASFSKPPVPLTSLSTPVARDLINAANLPSQHKLPTEQVLLDIRFAYSGFTDRESGILSRTIRSLGGKVDSDRPQYWVVKSSQPSMIEAPKEAKVITEWALERSLYYKQPLLEAMWNQPVYCQPCRGFSGLRICVSGLTEMDQRHTTLLIRLLGAEFFETLTADRELLVAGSSQAHKVRYAKNWRVPVVSPEYLWHCAKESQILPITEPFILDGLGSRPAPRGSPTINTRSAESAPPKPSHKHLKIGRMVASGMRSAADTTYDTSFDVSTIDSSIDTSVDTSVDTSMDVSMSQILAPDNEVRYLDDDAADKAQILLAMGERPPTPPPAEPKPVTIRSTIYSRRRRL